ncbi:metal-sensitive transcriptional regulator [Pelosinus fermentans]|uniref:Metal sensitive transcriptional repressor n=1 Tax=Pelosinus fermentans JBW45 TaxID=1192197 RepID=I9DAQ5_9FIRM|nr:metal-sensitive transcriptional regulator [Pelosinus fermentans]AJQ29080.1 metal sensitive transcriptional repressor [Pelosinus fermentans JBW45]
MPNTSTQKEVLNRLRNIKGHVAGIERMVGENAPCKDVLLQLLAIRSSIEKTGIFILENNAAECLLSDSIPAEEKVKVNQLVKDIVAFLK